MQIKDILAEIERFAPLVYQESYDNCGVQVGDVTQQATGALLCLDVTEAVMDEAVSAGCNLVIAHHPLIFSGLKSITGRNYVERVILKAIRHDVVIYAAHTNLDNVRSGVNRKIAEKLGLVETRILAPVTGKLDKLYTYVPLSHAETVKAALFEAGAGAVGDYTECSFSATGKGTFRPSGIAHPFIGQAGGPRETVEELKLEVLVPASCRAQVLHALQRSHPYEEVAYELVALGNEDQTIGAGMTGRLNEPVPVREFLSFLKDRMKTACIRHTQPAGETISTVAVCGGSGSFLLRQAIAARADIFITADYKYHQFFEAEHRIMIADIGHYESEQFTIEIFSEILKGKFPNFALLFTKVHTNPVNYYF